MKALYFAVSAAAIAAALPASASVVTLGSSLARSCYLSAEARSSTPQSLDDCNRALSEQAITADDRFATHVNRGILRMLRRDYSMAQADFEAAIAMDPNHPEPWLNYGIMRFNAGDSDGAVPLLDRALSLGTARPEIAHFARGLAYEDRGNVRAAYADLTRAASLKPDWREPARELRRYQVRQR